MKSLNLIISALFVGLFLSTQVTAGNLQTDSASVESTHDVSLFTSGNYLMLRCQLNGKPAYFLIDTGASFTILHSKSAKSYNFDVLERRSQQTTGFGGSAATVKIAIGANLEFSHRKISMGFLAQDLSKMITLIQSSSKLRIVGIIGSDLLKRYGCRADLKNKLLKFS